MTESENTKMDIAIGICAYNESQNIERCIRSIYEQDTRNVNVKETTSLFCPRKNAKARTPPSTATWTTRPATSSRCTMRTTFS